MKKVIKLSLTLLGTSVAALGFYKLKRFYNDQIENQILNQMQNRYKGYPIKGTWIQRRGDHYVCEITIMNNHRWQHHQFRTDSAGNLTLNH